MRRNRSSLSSKPRSDTCPTGSFDEQRRNQGALQKHDDDADTDEPA